jgi:hypothetical protein
VILTQEVLACDPAAVAELLIEVEGFNAFTAHNDPYGEHDFGVSSRWAQPSFGR